MRDDLHPAAVRLLASLPVRTHTQPEPVQRSTMSMRRRRVIDGIDGEFVQAKPIKIRGKKYGSIAAARIALKISTQTIHKWLEEGKAILV